MNRLAQYKSNKAYRAKQNLLAHIHKAIAPELAELQRCEELLERTLRGNEFQGYTNERDCSRLDVYTMGHMRGSESLVPAESFESCALQGMDKAEQVTRNIADNNL